MTSASSNELLTIPGIGKSLARDLQDLGISRVSELKGRDPERLYRKLNVLRGSHIDRCVLYAFRCAVYFASARKHDPALLKWWSWSDERLAEGPPDIDRPGSMPEGPRRFIMTPSPTLEEKQRQFNAAMERYETMAAYQAAGKLVSLANISLQLYVLVLVLPLSIGAAAQLVVFAAAYVIADFFNGLVHMLMDNSDNYSSAAGPLIAAFHLHHRTPLYRKNPLPVVYFNESGAKNWLVGYLLLTAFLIRSGAAAPAVAWGLVYVGILSSVAEVSHYCCHVVDSGLTRMLRRAGLFLSKKHHGRHHIEDNVNYAFLNGLTDPVLNVIARRFFPGYKNTTDRHYAAYAGAGTANR